MFKYNIWIWTRIKYNKKVPSRLTNRVLQSREIRSRKERVRIQQPLHHSARIQATVVIFMFI
jgi:hypothetical protein